MFQYYRTVSTDSKLHYSCLTLKWYVWWAMEALCNPTHRDVKCREHYWHDVMGSTVRLTRTLVLLCVALDVQAIVSFRGVARCVQEWWRYIQRDPNVLLRVKKKKMPEIKAPERWHAKDCLLATATYVRGRFSTVAYHFCLYNWAGVN